MNAYQKEILRTRKNYEQYMGKSVREIIKETAIEHFLMMDIAPTFRQVANYLSQRYTNVAASTTEHLKWHYIAHLSFHDRLDFYREIHGLDYKKSTLPYPLCLFS